MKNALSIQLGMLCLILLLSGCDFPGGTKEDGPPPSQTRILEVRVEPNPVVIGDTATFTAIIRDSLDTSFEFRWFIGTPSIPVTEVNNITWIAEVESGEYDFIVEANNGDPDQTPANRGFLVTVVDSSTTATQR